jgi:hypothetical protein
MEQYNQLKKLSQWLKLVGTSDFGHDVYTDGVLESKIAQSQAEVCNKIGEYLEEILESNNKNSSYYF